MKNTSDWSDADSANFVLEWAEEKYANALAESVKAEAEEVGRAAEKFWDEKNPDDGVGGFSRNPYRDERERNLKRITNSYENFQGYGKILDFVRVSICNLLKK